MAHVSIPTRLVVRPQDLPGARQRARLLAGLWLLTLIFVGAAVWVWRSPAMLDASRHRADAERIDALQQRVTVLERAEQVARVANADLQHELRARQEEVSSLRADLAFYSRLTGASSQRENLTVQELGLAARPDKPRLYDFTVTLTQTLKPGKVSQGHVRLSISGMSGGRFTRLDWNALAADQDANGLPFSFRYFEQIKGTLSLPEGFAPDRIEIDAQGGADQGRASREFAWNEALKARQTQQ